MIRPTTLFHNSLSTTACSPYPLCILPCIWSLIHTKLTLMAWGTISAYSHKLKSALDVFDMSLHAFAFLKGFLEHPGRMLVTFRITVVWTVIWKYWRKHYSSNTLLQQLLIPSVSPTDTETFFPLNEEKRFACFTHTTCQKFESSIQFVEEKVILSFVYFAMK